MNWNLWVDANHTHLAIRSHQHSSNLWTFVIIYFNKVRHEFTYSTQNSHWCFTSLNSWYISIAFNLCFPFSFSFYPSSVKGQKQVRCWRSHGYLWSNQCWDSRRWTTSTRVPEAWGAFNTIPRDPKGTPLIERFIETSPDKKYSVVLTVDRTYRFPFLTAFDTLRFEVSVDRQITDKFLWLNTAIDNVSGWTRNVEGVENQARSIALVKKFRFNIIDGKLNV